MTADAFNLGNVSSPTAMADKTAIVDLHDWSSPREITYGAFEAACDAAARGFIRRGLQRGDAVAILSANRAEFLMAYFGAMRAGLIAVPVNDRFSPEVIAHIVADAAIKLIVCDGSTRDRTA